MSNGDSGASAVLPLLDGSTALEPIPELTRHGLQQLIELVVPARLGADGCPASLSPWVPCCSLH